MKEMHIVEFDAYGRKITLPTVTGICGNSTYENMAKIKVEDCVGKSYQVHMRKKSMVLYTLKLYRANFTILYVTQNRSSPRLRHGPDCSANG